jgi:hypothetical protein
VSPGRAEGRSITAVPVLAALLTPLPGGRPLPGGGGPRSKLTCPALENQFLLTVVPFHQSEASKGNASVR